MARQRTTKADIEAVKSPVAVALSARRMITLSAERRREIARKATRARWAKYYRRRAEAMEQGE